MIKLFASIVFFLSVHASAAGPAFDLDSVSLSSLGDISAPAVEGTIVPYAVRKPSPKDDRYFNAYVLKAVDYLKTKYGLLGYDISSILTHDIVYYNYGTIMARHAPLTMCVAAQMEVILTAYQLYAAETGDNSIYDYLPKRSFEGLTVNDIKGHIWVNPEFNANGTADALINFGMGERTAFEKLKPGSFVNINRNNRTGHAVTFLGFINNTGAMQQQYNDTVVGFKYFSSQGGSAAGSGGFDYRYAVFSKFGCPDMPYKRDCDVIYSTDQKMLNTGMMLHPKYWKHTALPAAPASSKETVFDGRFFNGVTTDD